MSSAHVYLSIISCKLELKILVLFFLYPNHHMAVGTHVHTNCEMLVFAGHAKGRETQKQKMLEKR
jgi:hypothetical protein